MFLIIILSIIFVFLQKIIFISIFSLIEQDISTGTDDIFFHTATHSAVIKFIPLSIIFGICCVMSSSKPSIMITNCIKLVNWLGFCTWHQKWKIFSLWSNINWIADFLFIGFHRFRVYQIRLKIQLTWESNYSLILLFSKSSFLFKSFQVENQNFWCTINTQLFLSQFMLFTFWTIPLVTCL